MSDWIYDYHPWEIVHAHAMGWEVEFKRDGHWYRKPTGDDMWAFRVDYRVRPPHSEQSCEHEGMYVKAKSKKPEEPSSQIPDDLERRDGWTDAGWDDAVGKRIDFLLQRERDRSE